MVRTQIQLTEKQSQKLKLMALERDVSVAELIRQSVDRFILSSNDPSMVERRRRAMAIAGKYSSDVEDLGRNHDKYLLGAFGDRAE